MSRTRLSAVSLRATVGSAIGSAALMLVMASLAVAGDPVNAELDLPVGPAPKVAKTPDNPDAPPLSSEDTPPKFFGTVVKPETQSIVYVIDQSGSMSLSVQAYTDADGNVVSSGTRLDRAKSELRRSIATLPESFKFNIVFFDECIRSWQQTTVTASTSNKQSAITWVNGQDPMGFTNTGLAASTALADKNNKMVLILSDGEPNFLDCAANYVASYDQHKGLIRQSNSQNARVDCFGIGVSNNPDARKFMQDVASENGGTYTECN